MADTPTTRMTAAEAVDYLNVWGEAELKKAVADRSDPARTETTGPGDPDCVVCGGDGVLPVIPHGAIAPGGPDELPCPFCHPELCNEHI